MWGPWQRRRPRPWEREGLQSLCSPCRLAQLQCPDRASPCLVVLHSPAEPGRAAPEVLMLAASVGWPEPQVPGYRVWGYPGNRLCCDATQNQGPVSQSHAGRSPLALDDLAGQIWTCLGVVQQLTIVWPGPGCQARRREVGQRGLGFESQSVRSQTAQIAGMSGPALGVGEERPCLSSEMGEQHN